MSTMIKGLAGLLCFALLVGLWLRGSSEDPSPAVEVGRAAPAQAKPNAKLLQPQHSLLQGRSAPRHDADSRRLAGRSAPDEPEASASHGRRPRVEMPGEDTIDQGDDEESEDIRHWLEVVRSDPDPERRISALSELDYGDSRAVTVLAVALRDSDAAVRMAALEELDSTSDEIRLDLLAPMVRDPDPEVRLEAVRIISDSDEPAAEDLLYEALADYDDDVRYEAVLALDLDEEEAD